MAASVNPSGNNEEEESSRNGNGGDTIINVRSDTHENSAVVPIQVSLRHNCGISADWTVDEQCLLVELLNKYASERNLVRYVKIATELKDKSVREIALRCRWMNKMENVNKRRKEDHSSTRKNKDKKEKVTDPKAKSASLATNRSNGPPYAKTMVSMDSDDGISYKAIDGVTGELLEQSARALDQISANLSAFKMHENINLFCQARNNILAVLNDLNDVPEIMKQMPPLPVKLNEELAASILPLSC